MILDFKGTNIHYTDSGKGHAVVLLHGFLESTKIWKRLAPELSKKHRVICIDLLGHGQTGCLGYVHTMEQMAEVVEAVLKQLRIRRSTFIGHSMGGYVALAFAENNPDNLKGLCLLNSTASSDSTEKQINRDRTIAAVKKSHETFIRIAITNLFRPKNRKLFKDEIKELINEAKQTPLQGIVAALEGMKIRDNREALLHFTPFKKMMIAGKKDPVLNYDALLEEVENSQVKFVEFPDGHMSFIENEGELLHRIMHFIEK
ncbi:alpha/beta hydrolase [Tamlana sp. 2_MG-2023]|uniref:alpha/beta fold hydrolase n=1 Tax=unclassified Tamlana TaxID=2614803 RepID=UPI0026E30AA7|nr:MULTISPECIES: alpha/beta hydrolase [unclassified Tamlana]MDO6760548.1 alpha/beta hydrolase [Tamlana sp. 2_MG-2023]MDO6790804.1 alpha/beta hydrolase [Tamlana sp. 1_MG-2023]